MAESKEEQQRPSKRDPRLMPVPSDALTSLAFYGRMAGWAGSVLLLAALTWMSIVKTLNRMPIKVLGILALLCIAFWVYTSIHQLVLAMRTRGVQSALSSTLFSVLVLAILVMVNYIGYRHEVFRADVTKSKQFSLSGQTVKILKALDKKVTIVAFVSQENQRGDELRRLLREYDLKGGNKLDVTFYDTKTDVDKVQEYGVRMDPTLYLESGEDTAKRKEEIQGGTEEQITSTILVVTTGQKTRICFLTGHGEASLETSTDPQKPSVATLKGALESQQYQVDALTLMTQKDPQVPDDCKLLVIAGAKLTPGPAEMTAITKYVDQGGNLLLMIEPSPAPNFAELLKSHSVTPLGGIVRDPQGSIGGRDVILAAKPNRSHDVSAPLDMVALPTATAFDVQSAAPPPSMPGAPPPPQDQKAVPLLTTYTSDAQLQGGRKGEFTLAVAVDESPQPPPQMPGMPPQEQPAGERRSRIIAIGDVDFISDEILQRLSDPRQNAAFAVIAVSWLVKNDKLVAIPPKEPVEKPFSVTDAQKRFTWAVTAGIVPLLIILAGVFVWWRRRV